MRYPATEKLEIIRLVEQSDLSVRLTLERLGIPRSTFYQWYDRYQQQGFDALEDKPSAPPKVWNRIPEQRRDQILELALGEPDHANALRALEINPMQTQQRGYLLKALPEAPDMVRFLNSPISTIFHRRFDRTQKVNRTQVMRIARRENPGQCKAYQSAA
jgi:transposase-like protein